MKRIVLAGFCLVLTSCASIFNAAPNRVAVDFGKVRKPSSELVITLAGPVPAKDTSTGKLYGITGGTFGKELLISLGQRSVSLVENGQITMQTSLLDVPQMAPGNYPITLKQRDAVWYAPDTYFSVRKLPIPSSGEKDRYLRGAFGTFALFVGEEKVVHSGAYSVPEVPGMRLPEEALSKIFTTLEAGDSVVIKE